MFDKDRCVSSYPLCFFNKKKKAGGPLFPQQAESELLTETGFQLDAAVDTTHF